MTEQADKRDPIDLLNRKAPNRLHGESLTVGARHYDFSQNNWQSYNVPLPDFDQFDDDVVDRAAGYAGIETDDYDEIDRDLMIGDLKRRLQEDSSILTPMMNAAWPLPDYDRSIGKDQLAVAWNTNCCIVELEGGSEPVLALTAGGMDLSWDIAEAYTRCRYYPPLDVLPLPNFAGEEKIDASVLDKEYRTEYSSREYTLICTVIGVQTMLSRIESQFENTVVDFCEDDLQKTILGDNFSLRSHFA